MSFEESMKELLESCPGARGAAIVGPDGIPVVVSPDADSNSASTGVSPTPSASGQALLAALARDPGVVWSRDDLLSSVWGTDFPGETRTVEKSTYWSIWARDAFPSK